MTHAEDCGYTVTGHPENCSCVKQSRKALWWLPYAAMCFGALGMAEACYQLGRLEGCNEARTELIKIRAQLEMIDRAYRRVDGQLTNIYAPKETPLCDISVCFGDNVQAMGGE